MNKSIRILIAAGLALAGAALFAADLTIDWQFNLAGKDYANNYLSFKGAAASVERDQYVPVDATTGASRFKSTATFNAYRTDAQGKKTMPGSLRSFFMFPVAPDSVRADDGLTVAKAPDGVITVRYIHRGAAYEFKTDKTGKLDLATTQFRMRVIGHTDNQIAGAFSPTGKVADADWAKIWNPATPDGLKVGATATVTGKIGVDAADSATTVWKGVLQFTLNGTVLKVSGKLTS